MATGWREIGGNKYYFSEQIVSPNWEYSNNLAGYVARNVNTKSRGSMYANEYTPDGHFVDETGKMVS